MLILVLRNYKKLFNFRNFVFGYETNNSNENSLATFLERIHRQISDLSVHILKHDIT